MSTYYPSFSRRPRIHSHSRRYDISAIQSSSIDPSSRSSIGMNPWAPVKQSETTERDPTRAPKLLFSFISLILIIGSINRFSSYVNEENIVSSEMATNSTKPKNDFKNTDYKIIVQDNKGRHFVKGRHVEVIGNLSNFADVTSPMKKSDVAFFWHIPRAGGSTVKHITASCLGLTQASEVGSAGGHIEDDELIAVHHIEGGKFLNVDTTTEAGIDRAISLNLTSFEGLHVVVSPFLLKAAELFGPEHNGRAFVLLRHPIERAVSMYYYLRANDPNGEILDGKSLEQYAKSYLVENNWMTRYMSNQLGGELTEEHEAIAREFLRRKCLVGLLSHKATSLERFERYFGWRIVGQKMEHCQDQLLNWNWPSKNKHPRIKQDGVVWRSLEQNNGFDIRLYNYAHQLFQEQAALFD